MANTTETLADQGLPDGDVPPLPADELAMCLVWSADEPGRTGEVAFFAPGSGKLGRSAGLFGPQRPSGWVGQSALHSNKLSREQLAIRRDGRRWRLRNTGRTALLVNGVEQSEAGVGEGDLVQLGNVAVLLVVRRPREFQIHPPVAEDFGFGQPDGDGIIGESPAAWQLRGRVRFVAGAEEHTLVLGPSGSGKELVSQGIHRHSARRRGPLVSRSAATIPEGLVDAEMFGNLRNYPNPGMPERAGLVGEAHGGTLFLDEIGELPPEHHAHLLRVLDNGEYQRLGESRSRRSDLRFIGATNRHANELKFDFRARMPLQLSVPGLAVRPEDVPLLARHLLRGMARTSTDLETRFFAGGHPRLTPGLVQKLITYRYTTHMRELKHLLWECAGASSGGWLDVCPKVLSQGAPAPVARVDPKTLGPEAIQSALDRHGGRQEPVWKELGLRNRHVLARLIKKFGLSTEGQ